MFANIGYFEKAPFANAVFLNNTKDVNEGAENQKIFSAELGYGFRSPNFRADLNVYYTEWNDKTFNSEPSVRPMVHSVLLTFWV